MEDTSQESKVGKLSKTTPRKVQSIIAEGLNAETSLKIVKTDKNGLQTTKEMTVEQWRNFKKTSGCTYIAHQIT